MITMKNKTHFIASVQMLSYRYCFFKENKFGHEYLLLVRFINNLSGKIPHRNSFLLLEKIFADAHRFSLNLNKK